MQKFLIKIGVFTILLFITFVIFLRVYGGYIDYFYDKFTTPKQTSLIIGDSRAFSGILPQVLDSSEISREFTTPTYNFCFTIAQATYGPSYLEAIKKKIDTEKNNQLFIIQVTPWMLSNRDSISKEESDDLLQNSPPHNMNDMTSNPNIEYLYKNFDKFNFKGVFRKNSILYKDGHLVNRNLPKSNQELKEWKEIQLEMFKKWGVNWKPSNYRLNWLKETLLYLENYGTIVFVRMPFDEEFLEIEDKFWPNFNDAIKGIAIENNVFYLDYSESSVWKTYDGHHLDLEGATSFTKVLSQDIVKHFLGN